MAPRLRLAAIPIALLFAVGLSGCFSLRYFTWDDTKVTAGGHTFMRVFVAPHNDGEDVDIPFMLVGVGDDNLDVGKAVWDLRGKFNGPEQMTDDQDLADLVIGENLCDHAGIDLANLGSVDTWQGRRTAAPVNDQDRVGRIVETRIRVNADETANADVEAVSILVGAWEDDGDGQPEDPEASADAYECGGGAITNIPVRESAP